MLAPSTLSMRAAGEAGPKILFEVTQEKTGSALHHLRHGVYPRVGTACADPFARERLGQNHNTRVGRSARERMGMQGPPPRVPPHAPHRRKPSVGLAAARLRPTLRRVAPTRAR